MSNSFSYLIPLPPAAPNQQQFEAYSFTHAFYDEVQVRQANAEYCRWYAQVAAENRQASERMRSELNPLGWFYRS